MKIHLAIYDRKHSGIASAALHLQPEKLILLHSNRHDVEGIKSVLNSRGIKCLSQKVSFDPKQIRETLDHILESNKGHEIVFNASCGYRLMLLVTLEYFSSNSLKSFVVDKFTNKLHWLNPNTDSSLEVSTKLKISEFLKVFSSQVLEKGKNTVENEDRQELTHWLIDNIEIFGSALASLNHIAMRADMSLQFHMDRHYQKKKHLQEILLRFRDLGLLDLHNNKIVFHNEQDRFYANGGWLENHVFTTLHKMRKSRQAISDISRGMEIVRAQGTVKNEIDVIAMVNNRLHIIECKTRKFTRKDNANTPGAAAIYRLETLKESLGGTSGKAMLVSYQKLSRYTEQRARDLGIYCCSHTQLKQLKEHLYRFIDSEDNS